MMYTRRCFGIALLGAVGSLAGCSDPPPGLDPVVTSVAVAPESATVVVNGTVQLSVTLRDANGNVLPGRPITWASGRVTVATVDANGMVRGAGPGTAAVTATSEGVSDTAAITVPAPGDTIRFASVEVGGHSDGYRHSCGRTPASIAYCWGHNSFAQLGNGSMVVSRVPVAVASQLDIARMSVGGVHTCGLTAAGVAYCWGIDASGQLGAGAPGPDLCPFSLPCSTLPLAVAGGLSFASLSAGSEPTCGVAALGAAYCWGDNLYGELGVGGDTLTLASCYFGPCSRTPLAVTGGLAFAALGVGAVHVCGLTPGGAAYCWGDNRAGQLGVATDSGPDSCAPGPCSRTPVRVADGRTFTRLSVGYFHSCALATDGVWYCWGSNNYGQLGNGTTGPELCVGVFPCSTVPVAVTGAVSFAALFSGWRHSCGVTSGSVAYCWGENARGRLGDGTTANSLTPVAVAGGLTFANVSPGWEHTCGLTTTSVAYCWGANSSGELGDGSTTSSNVPVRVVGQAPTTAAAAGRPGEVTGRGPAPPALHPPVP